MALPWATIIPAVASIGSSILGAKSAKKGSTATQTTSMPAWQTQALQQILGQTQNLAAQGGQEYFPGETVAPFNPVQLQALSSMLQGGQRVGSQTGAMEAANSFYLDPRTMYNPNAIPGVAAAREGMIRDTGRMLSESWLPTERGDALAAGQFGGSRQSIGEALLGERAADALSKNLGAFDSNIFQMMLGANQSAMDRMPMISQQTMMPAAIQQQVGDTMQNQQQKQIAGDQERWNFYQNQPYFLLDQLRQSAGVNAGQTTTGSTQGNSALGALGGLSAGLGMMGSIKDMIKTPPPTTVPAPPKPYEPYGPPKP